MVNGYFGNKTKLSLSLGFEETKSIVLNICFLMLNWEHLSKTSRIITITAVILEIFIVIILFILVSFVKKTGE
jgi:hypothetical protein